MRPKNSGTFDPKRERWEKKEKRDSQGNILEPKIRISLRQLREIYGEIPGGKHRSEPYWSRYLADLQEAREKLLGENSAVPMRVASLETIVSDLEATGRDATHHKNLLSEARKQTFLEPPFADTEILHPDMVPVALEVNWRACIDPVAVKVLNHLRAKQTPQKDSLLKEVESYISTRKAAGRKNIGELTTVLNMLTSVTGDIRLTQINVTHYRAFLTALDASGWAPDTIATRKRLLDGFLKAIECDHDCHFNFVRNPLYRRARAEGQKIQYSLAEMKRALSLATGDARIGLLLGMNCGAYWSDMAELTFENTNGRIIKGRAKNKNKTSFVGNWQLWPETQEVLKTLPLDASKLETTFAKFKKQHGFLPHEALRKGVAQMIQDFCGEEEARLYRGEKVKGTHGNNYIKLSPEQVAKLDAALAKIREMIFS